MGYLAQARLHDYVTMWEYEMGLLTFELALSV